MIYPGVHRKGHIGIIFIWGITLKNMESFKPQVNPKGQEGDLLFFDFTWRLGVT